jgi:hypothetical protein
MVTFSCFGGYILSSASSLRCPSSFFLPILWLKKQHRVPTYRPVKVTQMKRAAFLPHQRRAAGRAAGLKRRRPREHSTESAHIALRQANCAARVQNGTVYLAVIYSTFDTCQPSLNCYSLLFYKIFDAGAVVRNVYMH